MLRHSTEENPANLSIEVAHLDLNIWYMGNTNVPSKMYEKRNKMSEVSNFVIADVFLRIQVSFRTIFWL